MVFDKQAQLESVEAKGPCHAHNYCYEYVLLSDFPMWSTELEKVKYGYEKLKKYNISSMILQASSSPKDGGETITQNFV